MGLREGVESEDWMEAEKVAVLGVQDSSHSSQLMEPSMVKVSLIERFAGGVMRVKK